MLNIESRDDCMAERGTTDKKLLIAWVITNRDNNGVFLYKPKNVFIIREESFINFWSLNNKIIDPVAWITVSQT